METSGEQLLLLILRRLGGLGEGAHSGEEVLGVQTHLQTRQRKLR